MNVISSQSSSRLFYGENLEIMKEKMTSESVDLIYLDPPFNSARNYNMMYTTMTGMCIFLYRLNEKSITEWRNEHKAQIEKNEAHWREMFTHFNTRLDSVIGNK